MATRIIVVVNQKGGPGKTTVTMQLAGSLVRRGKRVLVADADKQATASRWASAGDESFPAPVVGLGLAGNKLHRELEKFLGDHDYIVVDCPPAIDSPVPQSALLVADLALIPLIPSPADLWASVAIRELVDNASIVNQDLKARLLMNQVQPRTILAADVAEILEEFGVPLCRTTLGSRQVYRQCAAEGQTVHDLRGREARKATREVEALTDELLDALSETSERREAVHG